MNGFNKQADKRGQQAITLLKNMTTTAYSGLAEQIYPKWVNKNGLQSI